MKKKIILYFHLFLFFFLLFLFFTGCIFQPSEPIEGDFLTYNLDLGKNWDRLDLPANSYYSTNVTDSLMSKDGKLFYVIMNGYIYKSSDGNNWNKLKLHDVQKACISIDGKTVYAIAESQHSYSIYKSNDYGESFDESLADIYEPDLSVFDCSDDGSILLFAYSKILNIYKNSKFYKVSGIDEDIKYSMVAVSHDASILLAGKLDGSCYISYNLGESWQKISTLGNRKWKKAVFSEDNTKIYIIAEDSNIIYSSDSGNNWIEIQNSPSNKLADISISNSAQYIYVVEDDGYLYKSEDYASSWTSINILGRQKFISIDSSFDGSKILASGKESKNYLLYSNNYLNSIINFYPPQIYDNECWWNSTYKFGKVSDDGNTAIIIGAKYTIYKTEDAGKTWIDYSQSIFNNITYFSASSDLNLLALINDYNLYISKDKGISWQKIGSVSFSESNKAAGLAVSENGLTIVAIASNLIYFSKDGGVQWTKIDSIIDDFCNCSVSYDGNIIIVTSENNLYVCNNNDSNNFEKKFSLEYCFYDIKDFSMSKDGSKIIICDDYQIIYSYDYGNNWYKKDYGFSNFAMSLDGKIMLAVEHYSTGGFLSEPSGYLHRFYNNLSNASILSKYSYLQIKKIIFSNDNSLIFMIYPPILYASIDEGKSWAKTYLPGYIGDKLLDFKLTEDNRKLIMIDEYYFYISQR
jgi:photosystem II stability/assembly factor-like uncharacterized protein